MRKCPFCNAEIEESAKFCIFCMTTLEKKQTVQTIKTKSNRWRKLLAAFLAVVLIVGVVTAATMLTNPNTAITQNLATDESVTTDNTKKTNLVVATDKSENTYYISSNETDTSNSTNIASNKQPTKSDKTQKTNKAENTTAQGTKSPANTSVLNKTTKVQTTNSVTNNVTYIYREARRGDDFSVSYPIDNCVVITDVTSPSKTGEYIIPQNLNGKTVIAIMGSAFCNNNIKNTVKKVVVPSTVKTIWNYAFANCYNLTDIYFCGTSIYTEASAFAQNDKRNGTLTIHCSSNCSDRNFRYYKNSASDYGAVYKEWNS